MFLGLCKESENYFSTISSSVNKENWVFDLSNKPLYLAERERTEVCPYFIRKIATKDIVCEIEAAIVRLPGRHKRDHTDNYRLTLQRACLPLHNDISKEEKNFDAVATIKKGIGVKTNQK